MKQIDILLRQCPFDYVIQVINEKTLDAVIPWKTQRADIIIRDLLDRKSIYGDELYPLIFHLVQSDTGCSLYVDLLIGTYLYSYDGDILENLDGYTLEAMDRIGSYNYFALKQDKATISETTVLTPDDVSLHLLSYASSTLHKYLSAVADSLQLSSDAIVTNMSVVKAKDNHAALSTSVISNLVNRAYIELNKKGIHWFDGILKDYDDMPLSDMDNYYPKMSLVQSDADIYMRFELEPDSFGLQMIIQIDDFVCDTITGVEQCDFTLLSSDVDIEKRLIILLGAYVEEYDDFPISEIDEKLLQVLDKYLSMTLTESRVGAELDLAIEAPPLDLSLTNTITQNSLLTENIICSNSATVQVFLSEDLEYMHGLEFYDDDLIMTWDSWTLNDMAEAARIA